MSPEAIKKDELFASLPEPWPVSLLDEIRARVESTTERLVVLDDDPTGGQTLSGLPVLAGWDHEMLLAEVEQSRAFFLLTNSRALAQDEAVALAEAIGRQLREISEKSGRRLVIASRGDSTLRGHHPAETDALYRTFRGDDDEGRPTCIFAPYFGEAGRFTFNDTQYVLQDESLVGVAETEYARDPAFAYGHSHLPSWLEARGGTSRQSQDIVSISIEELRLGGPDAIASRLRSVAEGSTIIVNALCDRDIEVFVLGLLAVEAEGRRFLYRTAASFVRVRAGIDSRPLLSREELRGSGLGGGLIVVGSYVDRTNQQLGNLLTRDGVHGVELSAARLFGSAFERVIARAAEETELGLRAGLDVVLYTSRDLIGESGGLAFPAIGRRITSAICDVLARVESEPSFFIVKGGSTASRIATDNLGVRRAMVLGQVVPGVPAWRLGTESRFPNKSFIIFPGNVGGPNALYEVVDIVHGQAR